MPGNNVNNRDDIHLHGPGVHIPTSSICNRIILNLIRLFLLKKYLDIGSRIYMAQMMIYVCVSNRVEATLSERPDPK